MNLFPNQKDNIAKFSCCIITKGEIDLYDTIEVSNRYDSDFLSPWSSNDKIEIFNNHDNGVID